MEQEPKNQIRFWLTKLEQESWQLELLVSGFTIFLLLNAFESLNIYISDFGFHQQTGVLIYALTIFLLFILRISLIVLIINLVIHLVFRGFWIGAVGLRSVGTEIDFGKLRYNLFFEERLKKNLISLDELIIRMDKICSVIFSFTFLIIFLFVSFALFFVFVSLVGLLLSEIQEVIPEVIAPVSEVIFLIIIIIVLLAGLIYLIDSLSLGFFKKIRLLKKVYYPIYTFCSIITLSFFYRSIYYNLISKFPKKSIGWVITPYIFLVFFLPFIAIDEYLYFPDNKTANKLNIRNYDDQRKKDTFIENASIPSMINTSEFVPLFIRYNVLDNTNIKQLCPEFETAKNGGIKSGIKFSKMALQLSPPNVIEENPEKALSCLSALYTVRLNNQVQDLEFFFYTHPNRDEKGLMTMIPCGQLTKGKHIIDIKKVSFDEEKQTEEDYANIPFWLQ